MNPFEESNKLIKRLMDENELFPMHLEMYLQQECDIICRSKWEDDKITEELEELRDNNY